MRRLFMATALLTAVAAGAAAASPPKPIRLVDRLRAYHTTHYVRGYQGGQYGGGAGSTAAEARKTPEAAKPQPRSAPQPARAD